MTGWVWCAGYRNHCAQCRRFVTGLWRHFVTQTTSNMNVCAECAEAA